MPATPLRLTLYSKPGCHLCDEMKGVLLRVAADVPLALDEIDISTDAALSAQYGWDVPVLMLGGRKLAKHRITEDELRRRLRPGAVEG
jgi:hypothetical protein